MPDYLIKDNASKAKPPFDQVYLAQKPIGQWGSGIIGWKIEEIWSDLVSKSIEEFVWISEPHFKMGLISF